MGIIQMNRNHILNGVNREISAVYRIRVGVHLDDSWSKRLGGMVITRAFTEKTFSFGVGPS